MGEGIGGSETTCEAEGVSESVGGEVWRGEVARDTEGQR